MEEQQEMTQTPTMSPSPQQPIPNKSKLSFPMIAIVCAGIAASILFAFYQQDIMYYVYMAKTSIAFGAFVAIGLYAMYIFCVSSPDDRMEMFSTVQDSLLAAAPRVSAAGAVGGAAGLLGIGQKEKRNVTPLMKKKVAAGQGWKCAICSSMLDETYEVDHTIGLFQGGSNDMSNLRALCPHCHRKKTVDERLGF